MSSHAQPTPTPRWLAWVIVLSFTALLSGLVISNLFALTQGEFSKLEKNGWHDFAHGAPMRALAEDLRTTPLAAWLGQRQRELAWIILDDLGPRVRQGCPGWLFLTDELTIHPQGAEHAKARAHLALTVQRALQARDQRLLIAVVPDKTRVEQDHLCELKRPARLASRYQDWIASLGVLGMEVIPLDQPLLEVKAALGSAYDRTDTHWRWEGAEAAAQTIAARLRALGFKPQPERLYQHHLGPIQPRWGDLVRLAGLNELPEDLRPPPDEVAGLHFEALPQAHAQVEEITADILFGEHAATRVTLVGTSFSRNASFADFLAEALHTDLGNLAKDGGGFAQSMLTFVTQDLNKTGSGWVIWEIPERVLEEPLSQAEQALAVELAKAR
jgi:alginate O-acetyltransferase complex protein AlgJ